jgi:NAD(P)H dehydrogenase (quinone)
MSTILLLEGWLVKDGNGMGGWKNRFCSLTFSNNQFTLDYFVGDNKAEKKGSFVFARKSGFAKAPDNGENKNCFSLEVIDSDSISRKTGGRVTFSAPSPEAFTLWEKAFLNAKAPVGVMPGVGKSFGKHELVVLGAAGRLGSVIVQHLSGFTKDFIVRAGTRDTKKVKFPATVQTVAADMSQTKTLGPVINGARCVFLSLTPEDDRVKVAANAIKACKDNGVQHVVFVSYAGAETKPGTVLADQFRTVEEQLKTAGMRYTIARAPYFLDNVSEYFKAVTTTLQFSSALDTEIKYNAVAVADLGEAIAKIMMKPELYVNKTLNLSGAPVSELDMAEAFSSVMDKKVAHVSCSYDEMRATYAAAGLPEWRITGQVEMYQMIASGEPCLTEISSDLPAILKRDLASPASLLAAHGASLRAMRDAAEAEAKAAEEEAAAKLALMKLDVNANADAIKAAEKAAADKAEAEKAAAHLKKTRAMIHDGGMVLKKMGNETGFKLRFVWVDEETKKLCWSKGDNKTAAFKSLDLNGNIVLTKPEFSAAKPAAMFGAAEPDGFIVTAAAPGQPSVDLKIEGTVHDCTAWHTAIQLLCVNKKR